MLCAWRAELVELGEGVALAVSDSVEEPDGVALKGSPVTRSKMPNMPLEFAVAADVKVTESV